MDWIPSLQRAITFMENNLTQDITVNDVADKVFASGANFQRVFHLATNITIGDYIRNRRLSLAGQELLHPKTKIADMAKKYRYDTQESFSRAYTRFHGINPSDTRRHMNGLKYFHPLNIHVSIQGGFNMSNSLEILVSAQHAALESDTIADLFAGVMPTRKSNKITNLRRIHNSENYFLCSAIHSVGVSLGVTLNSEYHDFKFYANFTGDNFTYLYAADKGNPDNLPTDSGLTNYFFMPHVVKKAFAAFGYDCIYISNSQIKKDFRAVMNAIRASVDKNIPVLAWGMGNVDLYDTVYNPFPEGCLIGGYDENDALYVNLYPGEERMPPGSMDEYGYSTIINGLDTTNGLFFVGAKLENVDMQKLTADAIQSIPTFLTLPVFESYLSGKYAFGKAAFDVWADTLETDAYFVGKTDKELGDIRWNLHTSPYCSVCTATAYNFMQNAVEQYPDMEIAVKLLPLYKQMNDYKDAIWEMQGGFEPSDDNLRSPDFRREIAVILRKMGSMCTDILNAFDDSTLIP